MIFIFDADIFNFDWLLANEINIIYTYIYKINNTSAQSSSILWGISEGCWHVETFTPCPTLSQIHSQLQYVKPISSKP